MMSYVLNQLDDENFQPPIWKLYLYQLQKEAPKPTAVFCHERIDNVPSQYGLEFHGILHRRMCQELLKKEGSYLIRYNNSKEECYTLSLRFSGVVKHYKLYFDGQHYVGEKKFDKLEDLISDGLVTLYLESRAGKFLLQLPSANYRQSPYFTLNRAVLKALNKSKYSKIRPRPQALFLPSNNLSPIVGVEGKCIKSSAIKIPNEDLNIKLEKEESPSIMDCSTNLLNRENTNMSSNESLDKLEVDGVTSERTHRFSNHTFTGLHWCGFCGNFLWGLMLQGVKCSDCGFKAHRPCSLKVPNDCCPDLKNLQCIFGMDLSTSLQSGGAKEIGIDEPLLVPAIVTDCIAEIEARGLTVEGLYRVSGSCEQIDALRLAFERDGKNVSIDEKAVPDINVVAGALKLYFRLLPLRLITSECFENLMTANKLSIPEERIASVKEAVHLLPLPHYHTLKAFICHLARVCEHSAINKMSATSLSIIFGPSLIHVGAEVEQMQPADLLAMKLCAQEPKVIEMLIVLHKEVFEKI